MSSRFGFLLKKKSFRCSIFFLLAIIIFLIGPRPEEFVLDHSWPSIPETAADLEEAAALNDAGIRLRKDNSSRIIWYNPQKRNRSRSAMLYLHGFSASWYEGEPLHRDLCKKMGMNLYLPRLASHGVESSEPMLDLRPDALYRSALNALALTEKLGERVIIAGTSTGAALALMLAAEFPEKVSALLLFSPNIRLADSKAWILTQPWGLQIARLFTGSKYRDTGEKDPVALKHWYSRYRLEAVAALQHLLEKAMTHETFARVHCPVFMGYFPRDEVVSVPAMLDMFEHLNTPAKMKTQKAFPHAGVHVITNRRFSKDYNAVFNAALLFLERQIPE